jgi:hypothetical protein
MEARFNALEFSMQHSRRQFITAALTAIIVPKGRLFAQRVGPHPAPRPGITGEKVLTKELLGAKHAKLAPLFESIREVPQVVDGIRCNCGCTNPPEFYSLLSCYEGKGMARDCAICQGQGRLAVRLHKEGKTLDEIRAAIDAKFS